jgi:hypothetical protein
MTDYLTLPEVAKAFHATINWNSRSHYFNYTADARGMIKYYNHVLIRKPSVKILVYSGLSDVYTVPFTYTMPCIHQLAKLTSSSVKVSWKLWHPPTKVHHGGHWQQWTNNVTYATVRAAVCIEERGLQNKVERRTEREERTILRVTRDTRYPCINPTWPWSCLTDSYTLMASATK